ncbi:iron-regulated ABC transporter permease protein SufD [Rhodopseudomonas thermotolerans]|uniref:Iron-regulated ABC transporter permease protein SufD n=2 Tax=Rhodopseudomonas TaxID=1073 RepID=A0A336JUQ0_9BRAD|nr:MULTISPECIES: Fe-S cluster assembly protein SufD [Rhodopseudomonas]RED29061.1 iron-regulated ABC transporter permease protein SufD [Rhodopseudomonas pentothenatexigens]REF92298.1 iron-regulated ABC transporter permease protein SufD [Rhodopseudomonas thermotolerans]SSW92473.1 Iron-regulated ABC transporter permease protein SufD [Rhodopseudomonas pentothenatexigens]
MNIAVAKAEKPDTASDNFAAAGARLPVAGKLVDARRQAFDAFQRVGLPHRRIEDWKYTDLRALMREVLPVAPAPDASALVRAEAAAGLHAIAGVRRLVLVDGVLAGGLSELSDLEAGLSVRSLREALEAGENAALALDTADPMAALNTALMTDGVVIEIAAGTRLARPLHILHIASGGAPVAMFTRSRIALGNDAAATVVESYVAGEGADTYQVHDAAVIAVGDNARLDYVRIVEDSREAFNVTSAAVSVGTHAHFNAFGITTGALVSRYQAVVTVAGSHSKVETNGVNLLNGKQHADTTLVMNHDVPDCVSREGFRAVVDDRGHSVFQGRINVRQPAQQTDAKMMTRALLLSDEAEVDNKPELEIFADDVACGHGAAVGALDDSLLFYLRARGLPQKDAEAMLIQAFVGEAIEAIADDDLRELVTAAAVRWLEARR